MIRGAVYRIDLGPGHTTVDGLPNPFDHGIGWRVAHAARGYGPDLSEFLPRFVPDAGDQAYWIERDDSAIVHLAMPAPAVSRRRGRDAASRLVEHDLRHGTELARTMLNYLNLHGSVRETANALHVHQNTVRYRLDIVRSELDIDIDSASARLWLWLRLYTSAPARDDLPPATS